MKRTLENDLPIQTPHVSLGAIKKHVVRIEEWAALVRNWSSLTAPLVSDESMTSHWQDDYEASHYQIGHNPEFLTVVRHVVALVFGDHTPSTAAAEVVAKYNTRDDTALELHWIEVLLVHFLFNEKYQADFLTVARELATEADLLIGVCCWAIEARQFTDTKHRGQLDYTRSAVANVVALILSLKDGPVFKYAEINYAFEFTTANGPISIWMPDFARFWFSVEMGNFCKQKTNIDKFIELMKNSECV